MELRTLDISFDFEVPKVTLNLTKASGTLMTMLYKENTTAWGTCKDGSRYLGLFAHDLHNRIPL